jgi:cbb3-type cytochrome oxidase subunit 3
MRFDINLARGIVTILWFALFIAIAVTAWSRRRSEEFEAASRMALEPDDASGASSSAMRESR